MRGEHYVSVIRRCDGLLQPMFQSTRLLSREERAGLPNMARGVLPTDNELHLRAGR